MNSRLFREGSIAKAVIMLCLKKNDRRDIASCRPISLINVDVKLGSKAIAKRLEAVLPSVIHHNQCAYVKDKLFVRP